MSMFASRPLQLTGCCAGVLFRLLGTSAGGNRPVSATLTEAYGDSILQFRDGRWQHAYIHACEQGKPLLVYLHSEHNPVRCHRKAACIIPSHEKTFMLMYPCYACRPLQSSAVRRCVMKM